MGKQKLSVGDAAPQFKATATDGRKIDLVGYRDKSVLLVFFRYAGCPWCNLAIHRLALEYPMLQKENCEVIAFVQSDKNNIEQNIYARHEVKPSFPIIADPEWKFYNKYGVGRSYKAAMKSIRAIPQWIHSVKAHGFEQAEIDGDLFLVPAAFLVTPHTQLVSKANYGSSFYEFESFFKIYESLVFRHA